jgi:hypothetical protein
VRDFTTIYFSVKIRLNRKPTSIDHSSNLPAKQEMKMLFPVLIFLGAVAVKHVDGATRLMNNVQPLLKCRVTMACVSLARVNSSNAKQDPHHYECSPVESGKVSDFSYVIDLPTDLVKNNAHKLSRGLFS